MSIKHEDDDNFDEDFLDTYNEAKESKSSDIDNNSINQFKKPPIEKHNVPDDFKLLVLNLIMANMSKSLVEATELQRIREKRREEQVYQLRKIASNIYSEEFDKILRDLSNPVEVDEKDPLRGEIQMMIKKEICQKLFSQKDILEDSVIKKKSVDEDEENNASNTNPDDAHSLTTPQRRRMAPSIDLQFMSPIMSPPPGMILDEDEICTPNGISRADSNLNGFALPPSQAFVNFTPQRLNFNSPSNLSIDTDLTQSPPPPALAISPYRLKSSRLTRCTTFSPTLKDTTVQIHNTVFSQKPRAMTTLESDIIIPDWGDDSYNDTEEESESSNSPFRYNNRPEARSAMDPVFTPQLCRSQTTIDGNDPLTLTKRRDKTKISSGSNTSSGSNGDKSRHRRRLPPFSPDRGAAMANRSKMTSSSAGDATFAELSAGYHNKGYDRPRSTGDGSLGFNNCYNNNKYENFFPMSEVPVDLMRLKNFVLHCPFDNERDPRWFRCMIRRKKDPKTVYECGFFSEQMPSQFLVICYARRKRFISTSKYIISLLESDLFDKIKGEGYLDDEPDSYINYGIIMNTPNNKNPAYNYQVCIPSLLRNGEPSYVWRSKKNEKDPLYQAFVEIQEKGAQNALYEDKIKCFSLPTRIIGRTMQYQMTTVNSIKNCSLIKASPESLPLKMDLFKSSSKLVSGLDDLDTCFRFSKTSDALYTLDFRYPFSLFQAFAVALSRF